MIVVIGRRIKCSTSQAKDKIFIGNVPKNWTLEDMEKVSRRVGPYIESVELLKSIQDKRCQTLNLTLTITLQPLAGLTQKMPSPQLLFRCLLLEEY
ncbi:hypothetical protein Hanom_Chr06g00532881 [Helianthus anomalus]